MKYIPNPGGEPFVTIELTRRNLLVLLAKLDGYPPDSACTIIDSTGYIAVKAVEDAEHYSGRDPGRMAAETEAVL